ncbi:hypothetical protein [Spirillospora sp. CA-128828]|uniref:hypothetical protein n=1 Tax=Spirillospora sp. CA-128828 TaxID=3240033 RepID=UPI003D89CCE8
MGELHRMYDDVPPPSPVVLAEGRARWSPSPGTADPAARDPGGTAACWRSPWPARWPPGP